MHSTYVRTYVYIHVCNLIAVNITSLAISFVHAACFPVHTHLGHCVCVLFLVCPVVVADKALLTLWVVQWSLHSLLFTGLTLCRSDLPPSPVSSRYRVSRTWLVPPIKLTQ